MSALTGRVLGVLANEWPLPGSTGHIAETAGLPGAFRRAAAWCALAMLARQGIAERVALPDVRRPYWRLVIS
jgi:hypothetical protein